MQHFKLNCLKIIIDFEGIWKLNREPKISEIEKLIQHFRDTNREDELFEVLNTHNIGHPSDPEEVVNPETHEFYEEGMVLHTISKKQGLTVHHKKHFGKYIDFQKTKWYWRYLLYFFAIFVAIFLILNIPIIISRLTPVNTNTNKLITTQEITSSTVADSATLDPGEVIPAENVLIIPKIDVNAPIIFLSNQNEAEIQANLPNGVVKIGGTANPGEVGNAFITGHSSNFWWIQGNYNYVFANLDKLTAGDQAKIYYQGKKFVYSVREVKVVEPTDISVLGPTDTPVLTLMTCTPPGTNWKRLIVTLDQIAPKYSKPKVVTKNTVVTKKLPSTDNNTMGGIFSGIFNSIKQMLGFN